MSGPTFADVEAAARRIADLVPPTPVLRSAAVDGWTGTRVHLKAEHLHATGAFKLRGATNAVLLLDDDTASRGVAAHSSGNHAAALARAAALRGIAAHIVMPGNTSKPKQLAVAGYGGRIIFCEAADRERTCAEIVQATGATLIHPYNDDRIIAGQGTAALELLEDLPDLDSVVAPVGGGGLLSGTAIAVKALRPTVRVIGAEPAEAADAAASIKAGHIVERPVNTIADGLRTMLGERTFSIIRDNVDEITTVTEEGIIAAMRRIWEVLKIVVEPSGAVPFAAVREHPEKFNGQRVGIIISGGNADLDTLPWIGR